MQPELETNRLILRPLSKSDGPAVRTLAGDIRIAQTTLSVPHPYEEGVAEAWIATHAQRFADRIGVTFGICLRADKRLVGCISIEGISQPHRRGEIGYWIGVDFWNQGYATEALGAIIRFGFEQLDLNKLTARHMATNPASGRVMLKSGMKQEGYLRQDCFRYGRFEDSVVFGILRQ